MIPRPFDIAADKLPAEIDALFDRAVAAARAERIGELLESTQAIEKYFNFPAPDDIVRVAQIPGGMYTNMLAQLQAAKLEHLKDKVLQTVPRVRLDAGVPPLVTPTSQIVGVQAVNCVIDEANGKPFYTSKSTQFVNLVKGTYGKTPFPVDPAFRLKIAGTREETPYDTSKYKRQENPLLREFGNVPPGPRREGRAAARAFPQRGRHVPEEAAREGVPGHARQGSPGRGKERRRQDVGEPFGLRVNTRDSNVRSSMLDSRQEDKPNRCHRFAEFLILKTIIVLGLRASNFAALRCLRLRSRSRSFLSVVYRPRPCRPAP